MIIVIIINNIKFKNILIKVLKTKTTLKRKEREKALNKTRNDDRVLNFGV